MTGGTELHFRTHEKTVRDGVRLSYIHEGLGGLPILMLHGWPGGKRLFLKNVQPLVDAGFEVIVPDQRGFGETPPVEGSPLSVQESAKDVYALVRGLGHESCIVVAGDMGSGVAIQLSHTAPGFVKRFVTYNGFAPALPEVYARAGLPTSQFEEIEKISDHNNIQGTQADLLASQLRDDDDRLRYVASFFQGRVWREGERVRHLGRPGYYTEAEAFFMAEPLKSATSFRASLGFYESFFNPPPNTEPFLIDRPIEVETLVLWGMHDEIVGSAYPHWMTLGCKNIVGPFYVEAGHFVQWEAADILNGAIRIFCRDLLPGG